MQLTRRWFLGGAISLAAASVTQLPSGVGAVARELKSGNKPQIWADGTHDDSHGIGALLRQEVVLLPTSGIIIHSHGGCTIHQGNFRINTEVNVPPHAVFDIQSARFFGDNLESDQAFFCIPGKMAQKFSGNPGIIWICKTPKEIILRSHDEYDGDTQRIA